MLETNPMPQEKPDAKDILQENDPDRSACAAS